MLRLRHLATCVMLVACGTPQKQQPAAADTASSATLASRDCGPAVLADSGIGELRIGAPVDSIRVRCNVLRDTTEIRAEGMPSRVLSVAIGSDTIEAEVVNDSIWRIEVARSTPRTTDSLGVGTQLGRLLQMRGARGMMGEGAVFVMSPEHCGLSFQLSSAGWERLPSRLDSAGLRALPPSTAVARVLIVGCNMAG